MRTELLELLKDKLPSLARSIYDNDKYAHFVYDDDHVDIDYDNDTGVITYEFATRYIGDERYKDDIAGVNTEQLMHIVHKLQRVHHKYQISYHNFLLALLEEN